MNTFAAFLKKWRKTVGFVIILFVVGGVLIGRAIYGKTDEVRYVLETATRGTLTNAVTATGQVQGEAEIEIKPEVAGKVVQVVAEDGIHVEEGDVLAILDSGDAQKAVRDAELALANAKIDYEEFMEPADALSILRAERAVSEAENALDDLLGGADNDDVEDARDAVEDAELALEKAQRSLEDLVRNTDRDLENTSTEGYNEVVEAFSDLSDAMNGLSDVIGTEYRQEEYIPYYELLVGEKYSDPVLEAYEDAEDAYDLAWAAYLNTTRDSSLEERQEAVQFATDVAEELANAFNVTQTLLNVIADEGYADSAIRDHIDDLTASVPTYLSQMNALASSLRNTYNNIDDLLHDSPYDIQDAEANVRDAEKNLERMQEALDELYEEADGEEVAIAQEELREKELELEELTAGASDLEIYAQQLTLQDREDALADALEDLEKYTLRAPLAGYLTNYSVQVGETLTNASVIGTVIADKFTTTVALNEVDISGIEKGDPVTLAFDAIPDLAATGKVAQVSALGVVSQGVVSYNVVIALDTEDERVLSGMSVVANIITEVRQNVVMVSGTAVKTQGGTSFVEVLDGVTETGGAQGVTSETEPRRVEVETGIASDTQIEVVSGLEEGQFVVTRTITESSDTSSQAAPSTGGFGGASSSVIPSGGGFTGQRPF